MTKKPILTDKPIILYCCYFQQHYFLHLNQFYRNTAFIKTQKLISLKQTDIKIIYHFCIYNFIKSSIFQIFLIDFQHLHKEAVIYFSCFHLYLYFFFFVYLLNLGNIKTNGFITSSKYSIKNLKLLFVSMKFQATILLISTLQILVFRTIKVFFCCFSLTKSRHYYNIKKSYIFLAN